MAAAESQKPSLRLSAAKAMVRLVQRQIVGLDVAAVILWSVSGLADISAPAREAWHEALLTAAACKPVSI